MSKFIVSSVVAIAGFATVATAANCSSQSGCQILCDTEDIMFDFAVNYCENWKTPGFATYGPASASTTGPFASQSDCLTAFDDIVDQCYGLTNGGDYQFDNTLTVYFCDCEIA